MDTAQIIQASARQRRGVADLLESLIDEQLAAPSLCGDWDVRSVGAHLAMAVRPSLGPVLRALVAARGNLHRANADAARQMAGTPVAELARLLRDNAESDFAPPFTGVRAPLTDVLVHEGDMRVPLGLPYSPPADAVTVALEFVTGGRPIGFVSRGRLAGLELVAEDLPWRWGTGASLAGRGIDLLMAACGRAALLTRLSGPGVDVLAGRLEP